MFKKAERFFSSEFEVGMIVRTVVAVLAMNADLDQKKANCYVHSDRGILVVRLRPGILVEKYHRKCQVAELGTRKGQNSGQLVDAGSPGTYRLC